MTKFSFDRAGIRMARDAVEESSMDAMQAYREAEADVAPFLGTDYDTSDVTSTSDLYKKALLKMGVDLRGVEPVAYKHLVQMLNPDGSVKKTARTMASDRVVERSFAERFPNVARIKKAGF